MLHTSCTYAQMLHTPSGLLNHESRDFHDLTIYALSAKSDLVAVFGMLR